MRPLAGLLVVFVLAGCASPGPDATVPPTPASITAAAELAPCDILEAAVDVPDDRVRPHVPAGFTLVASDGMAGVVLGAAACAQGSRAFLAIPVEPEDERLRAEGVRHFFEPEHLVVPGETFAAALAQARGNATNASAIHVTAAPPQPSFVVEGAGWQHRVAAVGAAVAPAPEAVVGGVFREWFPAHGGYGYVEATFGTEGALLGVLPRATVETGEGTLSREVLGAEAEAQLFVLDGSAYAEATLGFVPYP